MKLASYLSCWLLMTSTLVNANVDVAVLQTKAQAGDVLAMRQLADAWSAGVAGQTDAALALSWYERAAKLGDLRSILRAAERHLYDSNANPRRAAQFYLQAAKLEDAGAQYQLGMLYRRGFGVQQDMYRAKHWFEQSTDLGHADAAYQLAMIFDEGSLDSEDNVRAAELYEKASERGSGEASYHLAMMHDEGESMPEDDRKAMQLYQLAAKRGVGAAAYNLAVMHHNGDAVNASPEQSYYWFAIAAVSATEDAVQRKTQAAEALKAEQIQRLDQDVAAFVAARKVK